MVSPGLWLHQPALTQDPQWPVKCPSGHHPPVSCENLWELGTSLVFRRLSTFTSVILSKTHLQKCKIGVGSTLLGTHTRIFSRFSSIWEQLQHLGCIFCFWFAKNDRGELPSPTPALQHCSFSVEEATSDVQNTGQCLSDIISHGLVCT